MAGTKICLKLLIDTKAKKVLFAEAGKEFVDFLFHIMSLPIGTIVKLLNVKGMVGCLGSLYKSIESLNSDYFQTNLGKDAVLKPRAAVSVPLLELNDAPVGNKFYCCASGYHHRYVANDPSTTCPAGCGHKMSTELTFAIPKISVDIASSTNRTGGYVKGVVTYMVMDNLEVKPMSTISGITLMNKFNVKDISALMEKEVEVGLKEGLGMLKASLVTNSVLTTVFLGKST